MRQRRVTCRPSLPPTIGTLAALCLWTGMLWPGPAHGQVQEAGLKTAFVYNFLLFTQWPPDALDARGTLRLCAFAGEPLRSALRGLEGRPVGERRIVVQVPEGDAAAAACDVAVLGATGPAGDPALAQALAGRSVLTVSDGGDIGRNGAMIVMVREDNRIRFDIDSQRAERARLGLSSRMLRLARRVL